MFINSLLLFLIIITASRSLDAKEWKKCAKNMRKTIQTVFGKALKSEKKQTAKKENHNFLLCLIVLDTVQMLSDHF